MKVELLFALVLCCVFRYSLSASSTKAVPAAVTTKAAPAAAAVTTKAAPAAVTTKAAPAAAAVTTKAAPAAAAVTTKAAGPAAAVTTKTTTTAKPITCYNLNCKNDGCLKNVTKPAGATTCTGPQCKIASAKSGNVTTITASCAATCKTSSSVFCCNTDKCNNDDAKINSGAERISVKYFAIISAQFLLLWLIKS